jgi:hypothetical protein
VCATAKNKTAIDSPERKKNGCGGCPAAAGSDLNEEAIPLIDKIRCRLFDASNLTPIGVHQPTRSNRSSKSIPKVPCPWSILTNQNCVERPFARHRQTDQRKICLQDFEERKRDKRLPFGERNWLRGLDLNQRPSGYEPDELPGCSTPRFHYVAIDDEIKRKTPFEKMILTN